MRLLAGLVFISLLSAPALQAQEQHARNYNGVLAALQSSHWKGSFTSGPGSMPTCYGSIDVRFFPMRKEAFSRGAQTVSYRHQAHFSPLTPFMPFCETLGTSLSAVNVSGCEKLILTKQTVENGRKVAVPVRTLIAKDGGARLVVSTPACINENGHGVVRRIEFTVRNFQFTDAKKNTLQMTLALDAAGLPFVVSHYRLERVGR